MDEQKLIKVCKHGLGVMAPRLAKLRSELKATEIVFQRLANMKYEAELRITEVKKIPIGVSGHKSASAPVDPVSMINNMSKEQMIEFMKLLENKIK